MALRCGLNGNYCSHVLQPKVLVTHTRKSLDADMRLIAKNCFCLFQLLLYAPVSSNYHVGMLAVERDVKQ